MVHLTPQEKSVVAVLLTVVCVGSVVHFALSRHVPAARWIDSSAAKQKLPDLNKADAGGLEKLPGVGPKTAQNIVAYRHQHGPFLHLQELRQVKGITKANYKKIEAAYAHP